MTVQSTEQSATKPKRDRFENLELVRKVWPWAFLATLIIAFSIASKAVNDITFLSSRSVQGILLYATQVLLIALAETFVIVSAGIDLSVGWILGLASVVAALVMQTLHAAGIPPLVTISAGMLGGILITIVPGFINGVLIAIGKVPSFIATLGMGILVEGAALLISKGYPIARQPPALGPLGNGSLVYFWPDHGVYFLKAPLTITPAEAQAVIPLMPNPVFVTILVTFVCWFILAKTQFGQHLYAIGGNFEAAVRAGIPVNRVLIKTYVMAAVLAGIAGVIWTARFTSGAHNAGETTTLNAIAAVVIGGASLFGGEGTIIGTVIGALIIGTIQYGLVLLGVSPFWQYVAIGLVVILAVVMDQFGRRLGK